MKKAFARKRKVLIIGTVFAIAIVGIIAILMVKQPDEAGKRAEPTKNELPTEVKSEIERLILLGVTRWSVDKTKKRINIFVDELTPEKEQFNGKVINGWAINVIYDAEYRMEAEKVDAELERLKEKPEMEIAAWSYGWDPRTGYKLSLIHISEPTRPY